MRSSKTGDNPAGETSLHMGVVTDEVVRVINLKGQIVRSQLLREVRHGILWLVQRWDRKLPTVCVAHEIPGGARWPRQAFYVRPVPMHDPGVGHRTMGELGNGVTHRC